MKTIDFLPAARAELLAEVLYYNREAPGLGEKFAAEVEGATTFALAFPLAGSPAAASTRRVQVKTFPFSVIYRPTAQGILVIAIPHDSRKPNYWKSRKSVL